LKAIVFVSLKPGVLDAQGKAIASSLTDLGFVGVIGARQGKVIELDLAETDPEAAKATAKEMAEKLLVNTVIESYRIDVLP
jgi:phosphoribosylformylglycinamidine synthase subunit PurS